MGKTKETKIKSKTKSEAKTNPQIKTNTANRKNLEVNVKSEVKSKSLTSVKNASIVKHSQTPKAKSKKIAKEVVTKLKSKPELKQKSKKPPPKSPSPSNDDDESSSEDDSESSESSSESPVKDQTVNTPSKLQMESVKKDAQPKVEDSDTSESDSSDSSDSVDGSSDSDESSSEDGENGQPKNDSNNESSNDSSDDSNESDSTSPETNNHAKINSKKSKDKQNGTSLPSSNGTVVSKNKPTSNGASHIEDKTAKKSSENESNSDENESDSDENESDTDSNKSGSNDNKPESDSNESDSNSSSNESESEVDRSSKKRKAEPEPSPPVKKAKSVSNEGSKNLFVGNLSWNVDDEWLVREFEEFGEISRANVLTDKATGRSKGFGYVEFSNSESAKAALEAKKGSLIDGREVNVDFSTPRDENARDRTKGRAQQFGDSINSPSDTLFCGNLSFGANEDMIGEAFGAHGTVVNVRLPTDMESGNPKGFGYVTFASIDEAKTAYEAMLGAEIDGRVVRLDYATPRPDRGAGFGSRGGRGRGDGRGRGGSRGGTRGGARGGRGGSTNRGGFGDFKGQKKTF